MTIYLGLGSNEGNRNANLQEAVKQLRARDFEVTEISPVVETPALLPDDAKIRIEVLESVKRPVNVVADNVEFKSAVEVTVATDKKAKSLILFDPDHSWDERILVEQFKY